MEPAAIYYCCTLRVLWHLTIIIESRRISFCNVHLWLYELIQHQILDYFSSIICQQRQFSRFFSLLSKTEKNLVCDGARGFTFLPNFDFKRIRIHCISYGFSIA